MVRMVSRFLLCFVVNLPGRLSLKIDSIDDVEVVVPHVQSKIVKMSDDSLSLNLGKQTWEDLSAETGAVSSLMKNIETIKTTFKAEAALACQRGMNGIGWGLYDLWHNSMSLYNDHKTKANHLNLAGACFGMANEIANSFSTCQSWIGDCDTSWHKGMTLSAVTLTDAISRIMDGAAASYEVQMYCEKNTTYGLNTVNAHAISGVYDLIPSIFDLRDLFSDFLTSSDVCKKKAQEGATQAIMRSAAEKWAAYACDISEKLEAYAGLEGKDSETQDIVGRWRRDWVRAKSMRDQDMDFGHVPTKRDDDKNVYQFVGDTRTDETTASRKDIQDEKVRDSKEDYVAALLYVDETGGGGADNDALVDENKKTSWKYKRARQAEIILSVISDIAASIDKWLAEGAHAHGSGENPNLKLSNKLGCEATVAKLTGALVGMISDISEVVTCGFGNEGFAWKAIGDNNEKLRKLLSAFVESKRDELCYFGEMLEHHLLNGDISSARSRQSTRTFNENVQSKLRKPGSQVQRQRTITVKATQSVDLNTRISDFLHEPCSADGFLRNQVTSPNELMRRLLIVYEELWKLQMGLNDEDAYQYLAALKEERQIWPETAPSKTPEKFAIIMKDFEENKMRPQKMTPLKITDSFRQSVTDVEDAVTVSSLDASADIAGKTIPAEGESIPAEGESIAQQPRESDTPQPGASMPTSAPEEEAVPLSPESATQAVETVVAALPESVTASQPSASRSASNNGS